MRPSIIADSSGLVSLISQDDSDHKTAIKATKQLDTINALIVVPSDVFSETLNVIGRKFSHDLATSLAKEIMRSSAYAVVATEENIREDALKLFHIQPQSVSFTDCVVMVLANKFGTKDIFGFDEIFKKNGYNRLGLETH